MKQKVDFTEHFLYHPPLEGRVPPSHLTHPWGTSGAQLPFTHTLHIPQKFM